MVHMISALNAKRPCNCCRAFLPIFSTNLDKRRTDQTQPVGFGSPAILQAPLPGPEGNSS
jgi:hypothetical protein